MSTASSVLSGLSLATGAARDAADGVPVVKQLLGVAARVVSLAQHIDKNRTDLHALADRAKRMDAAIAAALGDREPDGHMLRRLEDMNATLRAIERRFSKHVKRGRVRRVLEYIFTVHHSLYQFSIRHRWSGFGASRTARDHDAVFMQRIKLSVKVAANVEACLIASQNSRFIGEFRNVRHCEISLLRRIATQSQTEDGRAITCDLATCEGSNQIFIVRSVVVSRRDEDPCRNVDHHERILEELSFIQNRHPVVPYLYGRNTGPRNNRFAVLCAGDVRPLKDILSAGRAPLSILGPIVAKLVDASCHLINFGVAWTIPINWALECIYLDERSQPKIGLFNDLSYTVTHPRWQAVSLKHTMATVLNSSTVSSAQEMNLPHHNCNSALLHKQLFGALTDAGYRTRRIENAVRRADISGVVPFTHESLMFLRQAENTVRVPILLWGDIVYQLAIGSREWEGSMLRAIYVAEPSGTPDDLSVLCVEDDGELVLAVDTRFRIPPSASRDVRQRLGISVPVEMEDHKRVFRLMRRARHDQTLVECTGWCTEVFDEGFQW